MCNVGRQPWFSDRSQFSRLKGREFETGAGQTLKWWNFYSK